MTNFRTGLNLSIRSGSLELSSSQCSNTKDDEIRVFTTNMNQRLPLWMKIKLAINWTTTNRKEVAQNVEEKFHANRNKKKSRTEIYISKVNKTIKFLTTAFLRKREK